MNLADIRTAIANICDVNNDVSVYGTVPDAPNVPCLVIYPERVTYSTTYDGKVDMSLIVLCLAGSVNMQAAQQQMDAWLSTGTPESLIDPLEASADLEGTADSAHFTEVRNYGALSLVDGGTRYISAEIVLDIYG